MKIEFEYININDDNSDCSMESDWHGCCCQCTHHFEVYKHCCHSSERRCVCNQSLGFYICTALGEIDNIPRANLNGKHGFCDMFNQREK